MDTSPKRIDPETESWFPNLLESGYEKTSEIDGVYNCVAWAMGDDSRWWECGNEPGMYWPRSVPAGILLVNYLMLFETMGFRRGGAMELEPGFDKIAVYCDPSEQLFTHVTLQLENGMWTSKLGPEEDIKHNSLDAFNESAYGKLYTIMRREKKILNS